MGREVTYILVLTAVIAVSGCVGLSELETNNQTSESNLSNNASNSSSNIELIELTVSDIKELDFYSKLNDYQEYRREWAKPILLDDYAGTKTDRTGLKLYHREDGSPEFGESEVPVAIETAAYRFDHPGDAIKNMKDIIKGSDDIGSSQLISEDGTYYSREIKVETGTGLKVTAMYEREDNIVLVAATANFERYTVDETKQLMQRMQEKLNSN